MSFEINIDEMLQAMQQAVQQARQKEKQNITSPPEIENTRTIKLSADIHDLLLKIKYPKLPSLYKSLCGISLIDHPILAYVGAWSFFESLSVAMRKEEAKKLSPTEKAKAKEKKKQGKKRESFSSYFSRKIKKWYQGKEKKEERKDIREVIKEISEKGNANKHSPIRHSMSAHQLHNDFEVLEDFIIKCLRHLLEKQSKKV